MSKTMQELLQSASRTLSVSGSIRFLDGKEIAIDASDVLSASIHEGVSGGLLLGAVLTNSCRLTLDNSAEKWSLGGAARGQRSFAGAFVTLSLNALDAQTQVTTSLCAFTVTRVALKTPGGAAVLYGAGGLPAAFSASFKDDLTYPMSLGALVKALVTAGGGTLQNETFQGSALMLAQKPAWRAPSIRQALSYALSAAGCFCVCGADGTLVVRSVLNQEQPKALPYGCVLSLDAPEPAFGPLQAIQAVFSDGTARTFSINQAAATAYTSITLHENPLLPLDNTQTQQLCGALLTALTGLTLPSGGVTFLGDPGVLLGDTLKITDAKNTVHLLPVTSRTLSYENGGLTMDAFCTMESAEESAAALLLTAGSVSAAKLSGQLSGAIISPGTVAGNALIAGTITGQYLSAQSVTADKLSSACVTTDKLDASCVTAEKLLSNSVTTDKLSALAVTADKLAALSVTADKIAAGAVNAGKIEARSITADRLSAGTITAQSGVLAQACIGEAQLADASVTNAKIVSLSASKLTAGIIDAEQISVVNLCADNITTGTINGQIIPVLGTDKLAQGAVTGAQLSNGAVTTDKLVAGSVTTEKLGAESVTADKILTGAVTADKIAASSISAEKIAAGSITASCLSSDFGASLDLSSNESVTAHVLSNAAMTLNQQGIRLYGAQVSMNTDNFEISAMENGNRLLYLSPAGLEARVVAADTVLSPSVVSVRGAGNAAFSGSVQSSIQNLPKYLSGDVTLTVPAGTYIETPEIKGFVGSGRLTVQFETGAMLYGGLTLLDNHCPVTISGGVILGTGESCVTARGNSDLTLYAVTLFGAPRTSGTDEARTRAGLSVSKGYTYMDAVQINRTDDCVRASDGAQVFCKNATGGARNGFTAICTASNYAYLRDAPSTTYTKICNVPNGAVLAMDSDELVNNAYYAVCYGANQGYLSSGVVGYITPNGGDYSSGGNLGYSFSVSALARVFFEGSRPQAALGASNVELNTALESTVFGTAKDAPTNAAAPVAPGAQLVYASIAACCYRPSLEEAVRMDQPPMQGTYPIYSNDASGALVEQNILCRGAWFFENADSIAGKAVLGATLTLKRQKTGGESGKKTVTLYGHAQSLAAGEQLLNFPVLCSLGVTVELNLDEEATISLPASVVQKLIDGSVKGFALNSLGDALTMCPEMTLKLT